MSTETKYYEWVKASEELPGIGELVSARRNGDQYGCLERENDNSTSIYIGASYGIYGNQDDKLENIEWLRPINLSDIIREAAGKAFDAGMNRQWGESYNEDHPHDTIPLTSLDKETYLNNL